MVTAISRTGHTSVGPDGIHYDFFRHLSPACLYNLLHCFNRVWENGEFPENWLQAYIVPILKPGKLRNLPESYRPISLTSCACKLFEKLVNVRLRYYLETNFKLDPFQSGFRRGRSTADNIIRLTYSIQRGFDQKQQTVAVFLDLAKAYDRVHPSALLYLIQNIGIRGNMAIFLKNFLQPRSYQVRCHTYLSPPTTKLLGVPQGSVIAPTLFLIMINQIASDIPLIPPFSSHSIFADDVAVWCCHKSVDSAARGVQSALNSIASWCQKWGLDIAASKSSCVVFTQSSRPMPRLSHPLCVNNEAIPENKHHSFLGITLDSRLTYRLHTTQVKAKGQKRLNILRALSATQWGGDRKTLLLLYKSLVRSVLEYNSCIFTHIAPSNQIRLETVQNTALRIVTGAFRTTPINSLLTEVNIPTLAMRSETALFKYYFKTRSEQNHPAGGCFSVTPLDRRPGAHRRTPPAGVQITRLSSQYSIDLDSVSIARKPPMFASWTFPVPAVDFLFDDPKTQLHTFEILTLFREYKAFFEDSVFFYTDGSKSADGVGASFCGPSQNHFRLPKFCSIFSAELFAIYQAVQHIEQEHIVSSVVCSDSKSSLMALKNLASTNSMVFGILEKLRSASANNISIRFLWIPGHADIPGNLKADELARSGSTLDTVTPLAATVEEATRRVTETLAAHAQMKWDSDNKGRHTHSIKPIHSDWSSCHQPSRQREVVLARLRLGHTFYTHKHILSAEQSNPYCDVCGVPQTIQHLLIECSKFEQYRTSIRRYALSHNTSLSLPVLLGNDHPALINLLFNFLDKAKLSTII